APPLTTTALYTLSLHDALPIFGAGILLVKRPGAGVVEDAHDTLHRHHGVVQRCGEVDNEGVLARRHVEVRRLQVETGESSKRLRSEEHTSELQSRENLVCRLLL